MCKAVEETACSFKGWAPSKLWGYSGSQGTQGSMFCRSLHPSSTNKRKEKPSASGEHKGENKTGYWVRMNCGGEGSGENRGQELDNLDWWVGGGPCEKAASELRPECRGGGQTCEHLGEEPGG